MVFDNPNKDNIYTVSDPEISQAFYGKLSGDPHYYKIESDIDFMFYVGILVPKIDENFNKLSIEVINNNNEIIFIADGNNFIWKPWYEPYARDWYYKGPEIGKDVGGEFKKSIPLQNGSYIVKIFNNTNYGAYSLAIGEIEFFGSNIIEQMLIWVPILFYISPVMDVVYWDKFDVRAYIPHIFLLVLIFLIYLFFKKITSRNFK